MIFIVTLVIAVGTGSEVLLGMGEFSSQETCEQYAAESAQRILMGVPDVINVTYDCKTTDEVFPIPMGETW